MAQYILIGDKLINIGGTNISALENANENMDPQTRITTPTNEDSVTTLTVPGKQLDETKIYKEWTSKATKILIDLYKQYRDKAGSFEMKNLKMMFEKISRALKEYNLNYTPANCINRWKVLERKYKDYIDNQKQTGRGKKYFEFFEEMNEVFGHKTNIHPKILLTANTEINATETGAEKASTSQKEIDGINLQNEEEMTEVHIQKPLKRKLEVKTDAHKLKKKRDDLLAELYKEKKEYYHQKTLCLMNMYEDKKLYHNERLQLEKEKVQATKELTKLLNNFIHKNG